MKLWDQAAVILIIAAAAGGLIFHYVRKRRRAKQTGSPCAGGCDSCPFGKTCSTKPR